MKNVYTSWDLELLADKMIERIVASWTSPFCSPAVVFTDPKTEQWFKLRWLKNKEHGKQVLMNLKTLRIQQFLFDLISSENTSRQDSQKLSVELLRDIIIAKLTEKASDGKYYFEGLGSEAVKTYLTDSGDSSKINPNHLYDFSQNIASLFLDYEDTRPDSLGELLELEAWQQKLYMDTIGEEGVKAGNASYLTLFQLLQLNKKKSGNGSISFNWNKNIPVFIFGFSGIGQIYRKLLDEFSKENTLEIFLQLSAIPEKPENQLLEKWGSFGRENLELWSKNTSAVKLSSDSSFSKEDNILHRLQKSIAEDKKIISQPYDSKDQSLTLTSAPTSLREIEALHSKICHLLEKEDTRLGDILVVAPDIQDYKTSIEQVFDQNDQYAEDSVFPYIPYTIADYSGERSLTAEALTILFGIWKKGYLSRADLFALLHNYLVQTVRKISDQEVFDWTDWAKGLNVFRDRECKKDWQKAKNRLLLSRLTSDLVVPASGSDEEAFLPYESMTSSDNEALYKFIQVIDDLEAWSSFAKKEKLEAGDLDQIRTMLESWLFTGDNMPDELYNESLVFQNVVEEIERQKLTAKPAVFPDCFANALFDRSHTVTLHSANILTQGVTFANFESNRVLSAKYVFFLGLDSKSFPGKDRENELDLRKTKAQREAGDEALSDKNKNAFLCQLMAAREGFYISYVNKNLQKDEDFFKSSVVKNLFEAIYKASDGEAEDFPSYENRIKIDEARPWKELYTSREFRNKNNFIKLQESEVKTAPAATEEKSTSSASESESETVSASASVPESEQEKTGKASKTANEVLPDRLRISDLKKFLSEPFQYMVEKKLAKDEDSAEEEDIEFEPIFFDRLTQSSLKKEMVITCLKGEDQEDLKKRLTENMKIKNALPDDFFGSAAIESVFEVRDLMMDLIGQVIPEGTEMVFDDARMWHIKKLEGLTPKDWYVSGSCAWYNKNYEESGCIQTLEINNGKNCLTGYITALLLLTAVKDQEKNFSIKLNVVPSKSDSREVTQKSFTVKAGEALILLNKLYRSIFIEGYKLCSPLKLIEAELEKGEDEEPISFAVFQNSLTGQYGCWANFSKADFFDSETDLGYSSDNFAEKWQEAIAHQQELILFLKQKKEGEE